MVERVQIPIRKETNLSLNPSLPSQVPSSPPKVSCISANISAMDPALSSLPTKNSLRNGEIVTQLCLKLVFSTLYLGAICYFMFLWHSIYILYQMRLARYLSTLHRIFSRKFRWYNNCGFGSMGATMVYHT